jgi:CysZ protein
MHFFKDLYIGLRAYWRALVFMKENGLFWYIPIPALFMLGIYKLGDLMRTYHTSIASDNMNQIVWGLLVLMLEILVGLTLMKFSKYLVVILLSPLLAYLSQKCEKIITGNSYAFSLPQLYRDIRRGVRIALRNIMWHYFFFAIIFLVSYFGWEDPEKSPVFYLTYVLGFFYYGFSFMDYVNERLRWDLDESIRFVRRHRGLAIAIGMIYSLMILVPVDLGVLFSGSAFEKDFFSGLSIYVVQLLLWLSAASAPVLAIVAATIAMNDIVDLKKNVHVRKSD